MTYFLSVTKKATPKPLSGKYVPVLEFPILPKEADPPLKSKEKTRGIPSVQDSQADGDKAAPIDRPPVSPPDPIPVSARVLKTLRTLMRLSEK